MNSLIYCGMAFLMRLIFNKEGSHIAWASLSGKISRTVATVSSQLECSSNSIFSCNYLQNHELLEFAREAIVPYLEDEDSIIRREASICCCRLVEHSSRVASGGSSSSRLVSHRGGRSVGIGFRRRRLLIEEVKVAWTVICR
jgi:FKBP12-rapamycin complex-associated protein